MKKDHTHPKRRELHFVMLLHVSLFSETKAKPISLSQILQRERRESIELSIQTDLHKARNGEDEAKREP